MTASQPRLYLLDGLRGICAILIMGYHYLNWTDGTNIFQVGNFGVYVFFILSGFAMWYVYADTPFTADSMRAFYVSRFARIFPLYLLVHFKYFHFLLDVLLPSASLEDFIFAKRFLLNTTFLFGVSDPGLISGVPGGWSIGIEWVFYLAFPLLWVCLRSLRAMIILLVFSILLNQIFVGSLFKQGSLGTVWVDYVQFPVFICYFLAGIICAELYAKIRARHPQGLSDAQQWMARIGIIACMAALFLYPSKTAEDFLWGFHFPLLILLASGGVFLCAMVGRLSQVEIRVCKFLGDISFSAYLIHYLVYKYGTEFFAAYLPRLPDAVVLVALGCCTLVAAWLLYRFYEMPARRLINRKLGGHKI